MKKAELIEIAARYNMEFIREQITRQGSGVYCVSADPIPELDKIVDENLLPVVGERSYCPAGPAPDSPGEYLYRIFCPAGWIDLWGWTDGGR